MKRNRMIRLSSKRILSTCIFSPNLLFKAVFLLSLALFTISQENLSREINYGVDISFPMHHDSISTNYPWLPQTKQDKTNSMPLQPLGNRENFYKEFLEGCRKYYHKDPDECNETERDRIEMGLLQPQSMVNYTSLGFKKIRAPIKVFDLIEKFWKDNQDHKIEKESWFSGNTYTNHWTSPTYMVSVDDSNFRGGGSRLKHAIWNAARETLEEWTNQELSQCSLYGIRVYKEGSILATHVDRLPLVSSAIINVAQDVDEPWPLEVIGHDGKAYNITMEPGDMVLYESHSILHGRPFPLKGRYYANIFIHFEPVGHTLQHHNIQVESEEKNNNNEAGHENDNHNGLPVYLNENTPWEDIWKEEHEEEEWEPASDNEDDDEVSFGTGSTEAHHAASNGDLDRLKDIAESDPNLLHAKDENGWQPLHESVRSGHLDIVELLLEEHGADVNKLTKGGESPLFIAEEYFEEDDHPIFELLERFGAVSIGPDL